LKVEEGMESVFGLGGLGTRNLLQLVQSCYDLQQCFPDEELSAIWKLALGEEGEEALRDTDDWESTNRMSADVLTRWWYVKPPANRYRRRAFVDDLDRPL
jgi:hypothetical protein